jgi:NADH dehydrogenase
LLTFVVVGGGPTGVELAGTIAEVARTTMAQDFRNFDPRSARVLLVEGLGARAAELSATELSYAAKHQLERLGVEVVLGRRVEAIDAEGVRDRRGAHRRAHGAVGRRSSCVTVARRRSTSRSTALGACRSATTCRSTATTACS